MKHTSADNKLAFRPYLGSSFTLMVPDEWLALATSNLEVLFKGYDVENSFISVSVRKLNTEIGVELEEMIQSLRFFNAERFEDYSVIATNKKEHDDYSTVNDYCKWTDANAKYIWYQRQFFVQDVDNTYILTTSQPSNEMMEHIDKMFCYIMGSFRILNTMIKN